MITKFLFWIYVLNAIVLIDHDINLAYWKEGVLFKLPAGVGGCLLLHIPLLFLILYGLVGVERQSFFGWVVSLTISAGGIFAFGILMAFIRKSRHGFDTPISQFILTLMLLKQFNLKEIQLH